MKIAISGKGGTGKTTIAAGLIIYISSLGYKVYAVDADPDTSLGLVLDFNEENLGNLRPIVDMREIISQYTGGQGAYFTLNPEVDSLLENYTIKKDNNIYFLKMGAVKHGGSECYCRENTVLNAIINSLLLKRNEIVVLDMGAGIEHLTRGTARGVDIMLVVTEPTLTSVQTSKVVHKLAEELGIKQVKYIANKLRQERDKDFILKNLPREDIIGFIPFQTEILDRAAGFSNDSTPFPGKDLKDVAVRLLEQGNLVS